MHHSKYRLILLICAFSHHPLVVGRHGAQNPFSSLTKTNVDTADIVYEPKIQSDFAILPRASQGKSKSQTSEKAKDGAEDLKTTQSLSHKSAQAPSGGGLVKASSSLGRRPSTGTVSQLDVLSKKKSADATSEVSSKPTKFKLIDEQKARRNARQRLRYESQTEEQRALRNAKRREQWRPRTGEQRTRHIAYQKDYHKKRKKLKSISGTSTPTPDHIMEGASAQAHQSSSRNSLKSSEPEISDSSTSSEGRRHVRNKPLQD